MNENPKVFISYSHQNIEYENKVLEFSSKLRAEGIDANVDLYEEAPPEGWPRWMENQIRNSDYVLILCSKSYYDKFYTSTVSGKGISWEVNIIYQSLYDNFSINNKFVPVFFDSNEEIYILTPLKSFTFYNVGTNDGFDRLYWRLRGIPKYNKPPLGKARSLPNRERKTMFFSTPINLEKWNKSGWKGMIYLFPWNPDKPPILGCLFRNYDVAKLIFSEWVRQFKNVSVDDFIEINYIAPPFPNNIWLYSDGQRNYGKGYFVHIGPNIDKSIDRAIESGLNPEDLLLGTLSRYIWVDEINDSKNREMFKYLVNSGSGYIFMPIGLIDEHKPINEDNLIIDYSYAIKMQNATFKQGDALAENDVCKIVLVQPDE